MGRDKFRESKELVSREQGTIIKDWGGKLPIALIYPNSYYIGMSNLGIQAIYKLLNGYNTIVCERVFISFEALSIESLRGISEFSVLAFSISYELDYFNVVNLIRDSGIPLYAGDRNGDHPIVIAGGPCITANPVPLSPFFDCMCIGEGETIIPPVLSILSNKDYTREEKLEELAKLPGLYVPKYYNGGKIKRQWIANLDDFPVSSTVLTPDTELGDLFLIEVERGCNWGCRFCMVGSTFCPIRFHSMESIIAQAKKGLEFRKRIGLVGAVVSDHPQIEEILTGISRMGVGLSISSMRIKPLLDTVLKAIVTGGAQTITLAPEAGSQRLRQLINKRIDEDDIIKAVNKVAEQPVKTLKLYFMIGLPTETDEDIEEIVILAVKCLEILNKKKRGCRIDINVAPFIPKAGTPFQWLPMADEKTLNRRLSMLKRRLSPLGIQVKNESVAWSQVQGVLSRGDIRIAELLANMKGISLAEWRRVMADNQINIDHYILERWDVNEALPWEMLDMGMPRERLINELDRALLVSSEY
ncbi:MAG: radical SAM protein [Dehalococcoidales bacterium]|nr:radical SAM protein [Dehalococcoidales bacterium]